MGDNTIVLNQILHGNVVKNVLVWNNLLDPEPDAQEIADAIRQGFIDHVLSNIVNEWSLTSVTFIYNDEAPIYSIEVPFTAGPLQGASTAGATANQMCLLVSTTINGPPPNRGRVYFGGISLGAIDQSGNWALSAQQDYQGMVEFWRDGITTTNNQIFLRIARRDAAGLVTLSSAVENVIPREVPATQRKRRKGVGQ